MRRKNHKRAVKMDDTQGHFFQACVHNGVKHPCYKKDLNLYHPECVLYVCRECHKTVSLAHELVWIKRMDQHGQIHNEHHHVLPKKEVEIVEIDEEDELDDLSRIDQVLGSI